MSDIKVIESKQYQMLTRNICTGCTFFGGDDEGCNLPDDVEIECGPESIYIEVKRQSGDK